MIDFSNLPPELIQRLQMMAALRGQGGAQPLPTPPVGGGGSAQPLPPYGGGGSAQPLPAAPGGQSVRPGVGSGGTRPPMVGSMQRPAPIRPGMDGLTDEGMTGGTYGGMDPRRARLIQALLQRLGGAGPMQPQMPGSQFGL